MFKFFRQTRQNLLNEGKTARYFKYAVGEIVLVVIGILIALQINNWNEARKATTQEIILLENIQQDINLDKLDINFNLKYHKIFFKAETDLLAFLQSDLSEPKAPIDYTNALGVPLLSVIHKSTFTNLINNDIGIVSNNELKKTITRFYVYFVTAVLKLENDTQKYETYLERKPYFLKYFKLDNELKMMEMAVDNNKNQYNPNLERQSLLLNDVLGAKQDNAFKIELNQSLLFRSAKIKNYTNLLKNIKELDAAISEELHSLEQ